MASQSSWVNPCPHNTQNCAIVAGDDIWKIPVNSTESFDISIRFESAINDRYRVDIVDAPMFEGELLPEWDYYFYGYESDLSDSSISDTYSRYQCTQIRANILYNACWSSLKLGLWVTLWVQSIGAPLVQNPNDTNFPLFFLQNYGLPQDCSEVKVDTCFSPEKSDKISPSAFYVVKNIYCKYNLGWERLPEADS